MTAPAANYLQNIIRQFQVRQPSSRSSQIQLGPPNMVDNPYFDPAFTAQNAIRKIRADLAPSGFTPLLVGVPNMVDNPYFDPAFTSQNAIRQVRAELEAPGWTDRVGITRAQQLRDIFFKPGPSVSNWS